MMTCQSNNEVSCLVQQAQADDRGSLKKLVSIIQPKMHAHFLRMTMDVHLAADFTQEIILRVLRGLRQLQKPDSFWPWLFRIAANILNDHYRQNRRNTATCFSAFEQESLDLCLRDESQRPEADALSSETNSIVRKGIRTLKDKQRRILDMRCYQHMSYEQIGARVGCSSLAARTTFSRAKKAVRKYLNLNGITSL